MKDDMVNLVGVKYNGEQEVVGKVFISPLMKAREIATEQFGGFVDNDFSDANYCFLALELFLEWLVAQGWTAPQSRIVYPIE